MNLYLFHLKICRQGFYNDTFAYGEEAWRFIPFDFCMTFRY